MKTTTFLSVAFLITYAITIFYVGQEMMNERHTNLAKAALGIYYSSNN